MELSCTDGRNGNCTSTLESNVAGSLKLNMQLLSNPAIPFLGIYVTEIKAYVYAKTREQMFKAVLFLMVKRGKTQSPSKIVE